MKFAEPSKAQQESGGMGHPPFRGASCRAKHQPRLNRELVSSQSSTGVADPQGHETGVSNQKAAGIPLRCTCHSWTIVEFPFSPRELS